MPPSNKSRPPLENDPVTPPDPTTSYDLIIYVARLQPVLRVHLEQLRHALTLAPLCAVVISGAHQALSPRDPLTLAQRRDLLWQELDEHERARIRLVAARDTHDDAAWSDAVRIAINPLAPPAARHAVLYEPGNRAPTLPWASALAGPAHSSQSEDTPPLVPASRQDAHPVLDLLYAAASPNQAATPADQARINAQLQALAPLLPPLSSATLASWVQSPAFINLAQAWRALRDMRAEWAGSPYPPVFVTVDVVVHCAGQILLIRRGREPGKDLYALPGGFIELAEPLLTSALRELAEETCLELSPHELHQALRASAVFDAPGRSQRGRVITHAYYFDLGERTPPGITAGDDAAAAFWLPIAEILAQEDRFHDDHFLIMDHFLQVAGAHANLLCAPA